MQFSFIKEENIPSYICYYLCLKKEIVRYAAVAATAMYIHMVGCVCVCLDVKGGETMGHLLYNKSICAIFFQAE